jgi:hypothetical protein
MKRREFIALGAATLASGAQASRGESTTKGVLPCTT